jgi:hypothetical protein
VKNFVYAETDAMDAELKQYLDQRFDTIDQRFAAMETTFTRQLTETEHRIMNKVDGRIDALEDLIKNSAIPETIERLETRLLSEFWKWGKTSDARVRQN